MVGESPVENPNRDKLIRLLRDRDPEAKDSLRDFLIEQESHVTNPREQIRLDIIMACIYFEAGYTSDAIDLLENNETGALRRATQENLPDLIDEINGLLDQFYTSS